MALIQDTIKDLITPAVTAHGYEIWGVEFQKGRRSSTLTIYIDKNPETARAAAQEDEDFNPEEYSFDGIGIEDCEIVSELVSPLLDVADLIEEEYDLSVSSPGVYRNLFYPEQYGRYVGENVELALRMPQENRRKWFGKILEVSETSVTIDASVEMPKAGPKPKPKPGKGGKKAAAAVVEAQPVEILFANINKATLHPEF